MVRDEVSGRRRIYRLRVDGLAPLHAWLSELSPVPTADAVWSARFEAFDTEVRRTRRDRVHHVTPNSSAEATTPPETRETA